VLTGAGDGRYWGSSNRTTPAMSEEQLKAFQEAVQADAGLQEKLKAAGDADAVAAIAKAAGFAISAEELEAAVSAKVDELSDEELESVTGGATPMAVVGYAAATAAMYLTTAVIKLAAR